MKQVFFFLVCLFSLSTVADYGLGEWGDLESYDSEKKFVELGGLGSDNEIKFMEIETQHCISKKHKAQQEYTNCLQRCQYNKNMNKNFEVNPILSSCFCSKSIILGCY